MSEIHLSCYLGYQDKRCILNIMYCNIQMAIMTTYNEPSLVETTQVLTRSEKHNKNQHKIDLKTQN